MRDPSIPKVSSIQRSISPDLSQLQFKKQQELLRERFKEEQTVRKTAQESTNENDTKRVKNNEFKKQQETLKEKFQKQQQQKSRESSKERRKNQVVADMPRGISPNQKELRERYEKQEKAKLNSGLDSKLKTSDERTVNSSNQLPVELIEYRTSEGMDHLMDKRKPSNQNNSPNLSTNVREEGSKNSSKTTFLSFFKKHKNTSRSVSDLKTEEPAMLDCIDLDREQDEK